MTATPLPHFSAHKDAASHRHRAAAYDTRRTVSADTREFAGDPHLRRSRRRRDAHVPRTTASFAPSVRLFPSQANLALAPRLAPLLNASPNLQDRTPRTKLSIELPSSLFLLRPAGSPAPTLSIPRLSADDGGRIDGPEDDGRIHRRRCRMTTNVLGYSLGSRKGVAIAMITCPDPGTHRWSRARACRRLFRLDEDAQGKRAKS
ncbi:hypothetical protein K438DRAFT_1954131 [Mycena galopus ATCC 62051]|nr:hypothetical protein K438DRAFT_1954131 [Mycena galopus ATCC 62051]